MPLRVRTARRSQLWLDRLAPPSTLRRQALRLSKHAWHVLKTDGLSAAIHVCTGAIGRYSHTGTLFEAIPASAVPDAYAAWLTHHLNATRRPDDVARHLESLEHQPLISILMPVHNPPVDVLDAAIGSVRRQSYPNWTLCAVNGGSTRSGLREMLERHAAEDRRIRVQHLDANLGISGNSNAALEMAAGEFIALLDHDDLLAWDMLQSVVEVLNLHPDTDIVYFDEDKVSADGATRGYPWFKPQWSPELLLSTNVLMHSVIRRSLVAEVGGFDPTMDGAQDWDLMLRIAQRTQRIRHVPRVLYHWRQIHGSVALDANAKPWAFDAQARCLDAHLRRSGAEGASASVVRPALVRIRWPSGAASVSIIIPNKDKVDLLRACVQSIFDRTTYGRYEVILVDTGSSEPVTFEYYADLQRDARVRVVRREDTAKFNYSHANNVGARAASGDLLLFLNNDTEVLEPSWLDELAGWSSRQEIGVVGAKLLRPSGLIQHAGIVLGLAGHGSHVFEDRPEFDFGPFGSPEWVRDYQAVTGACMMVRRGVFDELGGFDEIYRVGYSDIEFCLRARDAGYRIVYTPFARLLHHEGASRGFALPASDVIRASCQIVNRVAEGDPYFNPNLSYADRNPSPAAPTDPTPQANIVRVLEAFDLVPAGASHQPETIVAAMTAPRSWPRRRAAETKAGRLLLVSHDFSLSGAPLMQAQLAGRLTAIGYDVTAVTAEDGPARDLYATARASIVVRPELRHMMANAVPLTDLVASHDLVLANTLVNWRAVHVARAFDKPSVLWIQEFGYGLEAARQSHLVADAIAHADHVVMAAHAQVRLYQAFLVEGRFSVVPYGLDVVDQDADTRSSRRGAKVRVLHVGSIEPRKGQDVLLRALASLTAERRNALEVTFVGRPLNPEFVSMVNAMARPFDNVHLAGEASRSETLEHIRHTDIFVLSSRDEVLPVSILEAMRFGKAIIASDVGGVSEAIENGTTGRLVPAEDAPALAAALSSMSADQQLRERLGRSAQEAFFQRHTGEVFAQRFAAVIRAVLDR